MKSAVALTVRIGIFPACLASVIALAAQLVSAPVEASSLARAPVDAADILPPLPAPVRTTPAVAGSNALFELTLRTEGAGNLVRQLKSAGASAEDAARATALIRAQVGPALDVGTDLKLGLGPRARDGGRAIMSLSVITDVGMERIERRGGTLVLSAPATARRISARMDVGAYWSLRAAGLDPEVAAQAAKLADTRLGAGRGGVINAVVGNRPARFGSATTPRLLLLAIEREGQPMRRLMAWPGAPGEWIDPDRLTAPPSAIGRPVAGRITSGFGQRFHPILNFLRPHRGVDFAARSGDPVRAAAAGCVVGAGWHGGYGRRIRIAHRDGLESSYSHLSSVAVAAGHCVRRGEVIGLAGASGLATGPHLHFELHRAGQAVDPARDLTAPGGIDPDQRTAITARLARLMASPSA